MLTRRRNSFIIPGLREIGMKVARFQVRFGNCGVEFSVRNAKNDELCESLCCAVTVYTADSL